jgi:SufS family cysteine desulfurase
MQNKLFSVNEFREQFPILEQQVNGHPLIYLDNAATTQKPIAVLQAMNHYYLNNNANVHRASHHLSNRATTAFERARETVCQFINANSSKEIIWTKGTTEGFNLLTNVFIPQLNAGDEVIISTLEHHANIVPWQMLVESIGIVLKVIPLKEDNSLDLDAYQSLLNDKTKFVSVAHISNALGIINPIEEIITLAHHYDIQVIIDGAQAIAHIPVDVQALNCDYYLFSGHKLFAPTGVGVLYGKQSLLDALPPWQGGGEMIKSVSFSETIYNELPFKFEAGTPNISGVIGLAAAIDFLNHYDRKMMMLHEQMLLSVAEGGLLAIPEVTVFCPGIAKSGAISFLVKDEHHSDIATLLDAQGIAVRSGSHCAMPLLSALDCTGTVRVSFSLYNTLVEVNSFIAALKEVISLLKGD